MSKQNETFAKIFANTLTIERLTYLYKERNTVAEFNDGKCSNITYEEKEVKAS
jgi:hypothetical protein